MDDVGTCEEALRLAMLTSDVETLNRLIDDDLVFYDHAGQHVTKAMDLAMHRSGRLKLGTLEFSETMIDVEGPVAVVMTRAMIAGSFDGSAFAGDFRYMRIWRRMADESWRIAFAQCTAVAG